MSEIGDYLETRISNVRHARLVGELVCGLGMCVSVVALLLNIFLLAILGFSLLFAGCYLSVHYELQRLDYVYALEKLSYQDRHTKQ